jgi:hypothetical protein
MMIVVIMIILLITSRYPENHNDFKVGVEQLPQDKDQLVIVSSHFKEDLRWLKKTDNPVVVCSKTKSSPLCEEKINKGKEASAYLKFIIQNYDNLPNHVAFIHGHEKAWHQRFKANLLDVITNCAKYKEHGFISLNNYFIDDRYLDNKYMQKLHQIWDKEFRPYLNRDPPSHLYYDCCAQFIVSKERILRHSKDTYQSWYNLIINYPKNDHDHGHEIATLFEYIWHIIFGEPDVITHEAYQAMFGTCMKK